jgi:hypothetical protein
VPRVYDKAPHELLPGEYGRWADDDNHWYAHCPGADDLVANLSSHAVVEHEDGTITVSPSILCSDGAEGHVYHGFLERGVWRLA